MEDKDVDKYLGQQLSGSPPREAFKQQALRDSTAALVRVRRRRSARRRAELTVAAVLIAGIAFIGGRLSVPHKLPRSVDVAPRAVAETDGVNVPSDLVAWLDAARLFKRLGMEERMARAFERAGGDLFELNCHGGYEKLLQRGLLLSYCKLRVHFHHRIFPKALRRVRPDPPPPLGSGQSTVPRREYTGRAYKFSPYSF